MAINTDGSLPDASAMVDISSTTKGLLVPRMTTTQQNAITLPAKGLLVFNTTTNLFQVNTGTPSSPVWTPLLYSGSSITSVNSLTAASQTLTTGTTGTDFNISSAGSTHTFNLPSASAGSRGVLSAADWATFNGKEATLAAPNSIKGYLNGYKQFVALNTDSATEGSTNLFFTNARARNAISLTNTGTGGAPTYNNTTGVLNIPTYGTGSGSVISVAALTLGTGGADLSSSVANSTTTPVITLNVPNASGATRGALTSTDWTTFNNKENAIVAPNSIRRYYNGYKQFVAFNSDSVTEGSTNLYYTNARAQAAITGTANRVTVTSGVVDISNAYAGQTSLTTLGTIGTGTWNGTAIGSIYGGTGQSSVTTGDLLYGAATNTWGRLPAGTNGQVLTLAGGIPSWAANPGATAWSLTGNAVTAGSQFLGSTNNVSLRMRTNGVERMVVDSVGRIGIGTNNPTTDLTLNQSSGATSAQGLRFTGNSIGGSSTGSGFAIALGFNVTNNKQLWLGDADYLGNSAGTFFRFPSGNGYSFIDAVAGDNSVRRPIGIGFGGDALSAIIFGADNNSTAPSSYVWDNGNMAIGSGYRANAAPSNGLLVQGGVGIGATTLNATNPEKLLVDAGITTSVNAIVGKGNINSYLQLNIQNNSTGTSASSDVVATANNGDETTNYVDMGVNGGNYTGGVMGGANDSYLYNQGQNFLLGTGTAAKSLVFMTGGTAQATNERMRIDGTGNVGIGLNNPAYKLQVSAAANPLQLTGLQTGLAADSLLTVSNGVVRRLNPSAVIGNLWNLAGNTVSAGSQFLGSINNVSLRMRTNGVERMVVDSLGNVGVGVTNPAVQMVVKDEIDIRRVGALSQMIFTNTAGTGDFRIGGDGGDIYWQGGGGRSLQMGSFWTTILGGDRQTPTFPAFLNGSGNTGVLVLGQRDASVPLAIQGNSATQTANLTEWRNASAGILNLVDASGNMAIGSTTFNATNKEKVLIDAGTTTSVNTLVAKGNINNYLQMNIQNNSTGTAASSDVVATANNGDETTNYVDMGINGGSYTGGVMGAANDSYLYNQGQNFLIGTGTAAKSLVFMTGGTTQSTNERMRIDGNGNVGIGTNAPGSSLDVKGALRLSGSTSGYVGFSPAAAAGSTTYTLPTADGTNGQALTTNGSGTLSWVTSNQVATYRTSATNTTFTASDYVVIHTGGTGFTWTLPTASSSAGRMLRLINHGTGTITLSQAITTGNGVTSTSLTFVSGSNTYEIISDGSVWRKMN